MRKLQSAGHIAKNAQCVVQREWLILQYRAQTFAVHPRHHIVQIPVGVT